MSDKGICRKCKRKILNTTHQKCMYCGAELPEEQRFSQDEISAIEKQQERDREEEKNLNKSHSKSGTTSDNGWLDILDLGDCGDSDPGC